MGLKSIVVFFMFFIVSASAYSDPVVQEPNYSIKTWRQSHFALDKKGALIPEQRHGESFYKVKEGKYTFVRELPKDKTALVVMDPWQDSGSPVMNRHFKDVFSKRLVPLVKHAVAMGLKVVIITNDPAKVNLGYASKINPALQKIVDAGQASVLYHSDVDDRTFEVYLRSAGITTLIYSGFASNICVIGMPTGMIPMFHRGFRLFFVPEASAATEFGNTWGNGAVHKAMTSMISSWVGEIIGFQDFMKIKPV